jgi:hypothetical protein
MRLHWTLYHLPSILTVFALMLIPYSRCQSQALHYSTSWLGNTYGGKDSKWVQDWVESMFVTPNGTVYTDAKWDEGGREVGIYRNGQVIGAAGHTHGWGMNGGSAVGANGKYLFFAQSVTNEGGNLKDPDTWPPAGRIWYGVSRRSFPDIQKAESFPGGKGGKGDTLQGTFLLVNQTPDSTRADIKGIAASSTRLYLSDPANSLIRVYDCETMASVMQWSVSRPAALALAKDGTLWVLQTSDAAHPARILHFNANGKELPQAITFLRSMSPRAICLDPHGRLLVADDGPEQNIKIYSRLESKPTLAGTFGVKYGVFADGGRVGPLRFHDLSGVGCDAAGNIYAAGGYGAAEDGVGTELEAYSPKGKMLWRLYGLMFVDESETDPALAKEAYSKYHAFTLDYRKTQPGSEWGYKAFTLNRFKYPQDPRLHVYPTNVWVRRIQGHQLLYMCDMYSSFLAIYRFDKKKDGDIAIPCGYFAKSHQKGDWPPNQPEKGEWIWRDKNGNGAFNADEFDGRDQDAPGLWGWSVDSRGDIWQAADNSGIRHFSLQGLDKNGSPIYSYKSMQVTAMPAPFNNLQRADYDRAADTMYLAGYTADYPNDHGYWKVIGRVLARYDHWSKGNRTPRWILPITYNDATGQAVIPASFCVCGKYLFTVSVFDAKVEAYDRDSGKLVGSMSPGPEVGGKSGWVDIPYGITARRLVDGEYIILVEEDAYAKNILYRWKPAE